jgi:CRP-like cAMP-binding protein
VRVLPTEQALNGSRLLSQISPSTAEIVRAHLQVRRYDQGEIIHRVGDLIAGPAWIEWGLIARYATDDPLPHERAVVRWPGEVSVLTMAGESEWPVSVVALTPVIWITGPFSTYEEIMHQRPEIVVPLVQRLARQNYQEHSWSARLASTTLRPRLRLILHRLVDEVGTPQNDGTLLDFRVTHELLATIARANRDEVGRAVRELMVLGLIARRPNWRLLIPDGEALLQETTR